MMLDEKTKIPLAKMSGRPIVLAGLAKAANCSRFERLICSHGGLELEDYVDSCYFVSKLKKLLFNEIIKFR
jgi:hypothetical protein